jgi:hypothetical protein
MKMKKDNTEIKQESPQITKDVLALMISDILAQKEKKVVEVDTQSVKNLSSISQKETSAKPEVSLPSSDLQNVIIKEKKGFFLFRWLKSDKAEKPKKVKNLVLTPEEYVGKVSMESDNLNVNFCPLCHSKNLKGKVKKENNWYTQNIKCKDPNCFFQKQIRVEMK